MEEKKYLRTYLTEQGPKWHFCYDFSLNEGSLKELESNILFSFKFHYGKIKYLEKDSLEKISNLSENEKKWIDICISEALHLKKNNQ